MNDRIVRAGAFVAGVGGVSTIITAGTCPFCVVTFVAGLATSACGAVLPGGKKKVLRSLRRK